MRILFLTARADFGGGPEHLLQLLKHQPSDVECSVACPADYPNFDRYRFIVGDSNLFEIPHRAFSWSTLLRLRKRCREQKYDILHAHGKGAGLYARLLALLCGIPAVHTFHGVHLQAYGPFKRQLYRLYERCASLFTRRGIAVSQGERAEILRQGLMPESKLDVVDNGVVIPISEALPAVGPPWAVISFSRFDIQKNSMVIVEIAQELRAQGRLDEFVFHVVGDGPDREKLLALASESGFSEKIFCPGATLAPHDTFAGALCYLSTSKWEGLPLAVLEAMAHGLPVVATDVVGNRDAVSSGETGFLYPEGDPKSAASSLIFLSENAERRTAIGKCARKFVVEAHDVQRMAERTFQILRDVHRNI